MSLYSFYSENIFCFLKIEKNTNLHILQEFKIYNSKNITMKNSEADKKHKCTEKRTSPKPKDK